MTVASVLMTPIFVFQIMVTPSLHTRSGVNLDVGLGILTGHIHWINDPFPCGKWPDIKIFKSSLQSFLEEGECVEADKGFCGDPWHVKCPSNLGNTPENLEMQARVRSHHKTVN